MKSDQRRRALNNLLESHGRRLHALLTRLTLRRDVAAELVQELFVRLCQSDGFDRATDPPAYAFRTAINLAMEWRRKGRSSHDSALLVQEASAETSPLERMIDAEQYEQLLDALSDLSDLSRESFVLRFIDQQPYSEIGIKMGKTPQQVRGLSHAAVRQLREKFAEQSTRSEPR